MSRLLEVVGPGLARRLALAAALAAGLLAAAPAAQARTLSMLVTFSPAGTITVTLPDGTPVGTTSGAPTVIPAGYYTLLQSGPGACVQLPLFELKGPGLDIFSDMTAGEVDYTSQEAYFRPNSTYTWVNHAFPGVVHTFVTTGEVEGTVSPAPPASASMHSTVTSHDIVGSEVGPFRGRLTAAISSAGRLSLAFKGKSVATLKAGRYTIRLDDRSSTNGLYLRRGKEKPVALATPTFVGRRSVQVRLTAGRWTVMTRLGKTTYSLVVR
ncbi:MAG TPA: hypothetical protein VFA66_02395 [Gaiellaceae bacterium]|nr:hypothetical protein [Gaiellaceae bacterium]